MISQVQKILHHLNCLQNLHKASCKYLIRDNIGENDESSVHSSFHHPTCDLNLDDAFVNWNSPLIYDIYLNEDLKTLNGIILNDFQMYEEDVYVEET